MFFCCCRKEDEEKLTLQITDMKERIDTEKERSAKLELKVQLHVSLKAEDKVETNMFDHILPIITPFSNLKSEESQMLYLYWLLFSCFKSFPHLQDVMLDDLGDKVTEVHCRVLDSRMSSLSTLEKLSSIEYRMSVLLQNIESIPEESLEAFRQLKDSERRTRFVSLTVI